MTDETEYCEKREVAPGRKPEARRWFSRVEPGRLRRGKHGAPSHVAKTFILLWTSPNSLGVRREDHPELAPMSKREASSEEGRVSG